MDWKVLNGRSKNMQGEKGTGKNMKKHFTKLFGISLLVVMLSACGNKEQVADLPSEPTGTEPVEKTSDDALIQEPENYVVKFDLNTTSDPSDDEIYEYEVTTYDENWNPVTNVQKSIVTVPYEENAILESALPVPEREGYAFAGWQTRPVVEESDLINGVSPYQWRFGAQSRFDSVGMPVAQMESLQEDGTATLYARWVEVKDIFTEEDLRNMSNDLYGAYRLANDIDLTEKWIPIGRYFNNYENFDMDWWTYAFRGSLDGNGHKISGMIIDSAQLPVSGYHDEDTPWYNDGENANGCAAMFGATTGAVIENLTLDSSVVEFQYGGAYCYGAPLSAIDMASTVKNVTVKEPLVDITASDEDGQTDLTMFISVSGMLAGSWNSKVTGCVVEGGGITLNAQTVELHGGETYVGGMIGECYGDVIDCSSSTELNINVIDVIPNGKDTMLKVQAGGLNASNTVAENCKINSKICVAVEKPQGLSTVSAGGMSGVQRYSVATGNDVKAEIITDYNLDTVEGKSYTGAVAGALDTYYTLQILMYTPVAQAGCKDNVTDVMADGIVATEQLGFLPEIDGEPVQWINKGAYSITEDYSAPSNIEEIIQKYGTYIPVENLQDGIIWIVNE